LVELDRLDEAEVEHKRALEGLERELPSQHPSIARTLHSLAHLSNLQGKHQRAADLFQRVVELRDEGLGPKDPDYLSSLDGYAFTLLVLGRYAEALPHAERAWSLRDTRAPKQRADTAFVLARLLWNVPEPARDRPRAYELAQDAHATYRAAGTTSAQQADEVEQWLEEKPGDCETCAPPRSPGSRPFP
jgi:tetratricopeptide (TPR) repeat protein